MKIAVIGVGYWGPNLVRNLISLQHEVFVFDKIAGHSAAVIRQFPQCKEAASLEYILNEPSIGAVVIAVPVHHHCDLIRKSLKAGKHVFIEKPLCQTLHEARLIQEAMNGTVLMTGHITSFSPGIRMLKQHIERGAIGTPQCISLCRSHCGPMYRTTDVLTEVAAHDAAILLMLFSEPPQSVIARGYSRLQHDRPDAAHMLLDWQNGLHAMIEVQWTSALRKRTIVAEGSSGTLQFCITDGAEHLYAYDQAMVFNMLRQGVAQRELIKMIPDAREIALPPGEPLHEELKEFVAYIDEKRQPATGFLFGKQIVQLLEAARTSMEKNGERITVT